MNLALSLLYAAERNPEAEAVVKDDVRITYAALRVEAFGEKRPPRFEGR